MMAVYRQLLISAGGGVIDYHRQSARQEGAALVIGLGGTGSSAVMKLKKEVYRQLKPDDEYAEIPQYEAIRYLVVDSDDSSVWAQSDMPSDIDRQTEFFSIATNLKADFENTKALAKRPEMNWLDYEHISISDANNYSGAGIRSLNRFMLVTHASTLYAKIKSEMLSALKAANGVLNIYICAGISGGTGSGIFLDVCYLVRKALKEIGKSDAKVCGYFFMPDVNFSVPEIRANSSISKFIKVNGYAALQELDYCMNFSRNKDSFKMDYGFAKIDSVMQPVDLCCLVSVTDSSGHIRENGYPYAMSIVAEHIISFLAKTELSLGAGNCQNSVGFTLEGYILYVNGIKSCIPFQHGACIDYNFLGAAVAEIPRVEIATYLGSKMFECFADIYDRVPTEQERNEFLINHQLQYEAIRSELTKGCAWVVNFPESYDIRTYRVKGEVSFRRYAKQNFLFINEGILDENLSTMLRELGEYDIRQESTSLISRIFKGLCDDYVAKLDFGPFYAKRMLYNDKNKNIINAVDGFIWENKNNLKSEMRQDYIRWKELDRAKMNLDKANILNERRRFKDWLKTLKDWYTHLYRVVMYQKLGTLLEEYRRMLSELDSNYFSVLTVVLDTLRQTFAYNAQILSESTNDDNTFTWKIISVKDIKDSLDQDVAKLDMNNVFYDLMDIMFADCTKWITQNQNTISRLISDFVLHHFRVTAQKTMTDYLKIKFNLDK